MNILSKLKSLLITSDEELMKNKKAVKQQGMDVTFEVPEELTAERVLEALQDYGRKAGYELLDGIEQNKGNVLMSSVKNQVIKLHEEILKCYSKQSLTPDEKKLNFLTVINTFYLSMGSAILAKVKRSNLIAQGIFQKLLKKSGPELFYREVAAMAGNKYGAEEVEALNKHIERAAFLLLTKCDTLQEGREKVIECAKAMYMYGLCISLK